MKPPPISPFEQRVWAICRSKKVRPAPLGVAAGLSKQTVPKWIESSYSGKFNPSSAELGKLAKYAGVTIDWLLDPSPYTGEPNSDDVDTWEGRARCDGFDPGDPDVAEVYQTAFHDAESTYGFAAAEIRRRKAVRKGKGVTSHAVLDDAPAGPRSKKGGK